MKQNLASFTLTPAPSWGTSPKVRVWADSQFQASTGEVHPAGNETANYQEITLTPSGSGFLFPTTEFDSTDDSSDPNATYSAAVFNGTKNVYPLFDRWMFRASMGTLFPYSTLEAENVNRVPLRDDQAYSKVQTDQRIADADLYGNLATELLPGRVRLSKRPADPADPEVVGANDLATILSPGIVQYAQNGETSSSKAVRADDSRLGGGSPTLAFTGYRLLASNYTFTTTSSSAVSSVGVRDPVDRELTFTLGTGGSLAQGGILILFTYVNASGETLVSNWRAVGTYTNCTVIVPSPTAVAGATGWNFYATAPGGQYTTAKKQNASPLAFGSPYTYSTYDSGGAAIPSSNTTGGSQTVTVASGSRIFAPVDSSSGIPSKVYQSLLIDAGTAQEETVYVTAKPSSTTFTAVFSKTHSAGFSVQSATGGIQEAIMSLPGWPSTSADPGRGGTVIIPPFTVTKAPIHLRRGVKLEGDGPPATLADLGGNRFMSAISYASTDAQLGAVLMFGFSNEFELKNIAIWSNTNAVYAQGAAGSVGSARIDGCLLYGNVGQTVHTGAGFRASAGTFYLRITNSVLAGSPAMWVYGSFLNSTYVKHCLVIPQKDNADASFIAEGIVIEANGGSPHGFAGGGFIRIRDITTENGNGALLSFTDVNFDVEQFDVADWGAAAGTPKAQVKIRLTDGYAVSTMRLSRTVLTFINDAAWNNQAGVEVSAVTTFNPFTTIGPIIFEDVTFPSRGLAIDGGSVRGPFWVERSKNVTVTASGSNSGGINNPPTEGIFGSGNFPIGSNSSDRILTATLGLKVAKVAGLSSTNTAANNLCGTVTLSGGTANVTFPTAEPDASYYVTLSGNANETFRWSSKATTGFTITSSNAGSSATVDWLLIR